MKIKIKLITLIMIFIFVINIIPIQSNTEMRTINDNGTELFFEFIVGNEYINKNSELEIFFTMDIIGGANVVSIYDINILIGYKISNNTEEFIDVQLFTFPNNNSYFFIRQKIVFFIPNDSPSDIYFYFGYNYTEDLRLAPDQDWFSTQDIFLFSIIVYPSNLIIFLWFVLIYVSLSLILSYISRLIKNKKIS